MVRARWTALVVVVALAAGVVGCGSSERGTDVRKVAFVAPYGDNEPDWTLQAQELVEEWPRELGVRVDKVDASRTDDIRAVLEQVSHEGNQLVLAHDPRYADAAEAVAERTRVPELVWGERSDPVDGLVGQITVQDKEGGYIAGIVTARAAITRRLGIVVIADGTDWDTATWNRMAGGFIAGARSHDPNVEIAYTQVGEDGSATVREVYEATMRMIEHHHSQMVFGLGGASTVGALQAINEKGGESQYVGVIGDKGEANTDNNVLVSVMLDTRPAFERALMDVRSGRFGERPYALTLRNRGVWLYQTGRTPADAYEEGMRAGAKIQRGALQVPVTPTRDAVEALLAGEEPEG